MENTDIIRYESQGEEVVLSPTIVRQYLVNGQGNVTEQEIQMFLALCKYQKLNPFLREVYLIKYGNSPATMVTGKETFLKRANHNPLYKGHKTGISEDGKTAWAEVYKDGFEVPIHIEVDYDEYVGKKSDGTVTKMWSEKPRTMLKKVALVQALREAFPDDFGGMYSQEEINTIREELPEKEIRVPQPIKESDEQQSPPQDPLPDLITTPQRNKVFALMNELGIKEGEQKDFLGWCLSTTVTSTKNILKQDAIQLIDTLEQGGKELVADYRKTAPTQ
jgi:phage recombination protein Bet